MSSAGLGVEPEEDRDAEPEDEQDGVNALRQVTRTEEMKKAYNQLQEALGIEGKDIAKQRCAFIKGNFAKFAFLVVILGCEIDLYGFIIAFPVYWKGRDTGNLDEENHLIMKTLLCLGPASYLVATVMVLIKQNFCRRMGDNGREKPSSNGREQPSGGDAPGCEALIGGNANTTSHSEAPGRAHDEASKLHFKIYHFLPVIRMYLVVKELLPSDIEALFRVNSCQRLP